MKKLLSVLLVLVLTAVLLVPAASAAGGEVGVTINGVPIVFDDDSGRPFIDAAGRTQVPFRKTLELYGCTVSWDNAARAAVATRDGRTVRVPIGQPYLLIDGVRTPIDTTAVLLNGRTYLPIRAVLEAFGAQVSWDDDARCVVIGRYDRSGTVQVHFIDVGQGDAALIDYGTVEVLIDAGDRGSSQTVVDYLRPYVDGKLDYVIATHPDADHIGGMAEVFAAFDVGEVIDSGRTAGSKTYQNYWTAAQTEPGCTVSYDEDRTLTLGRGTTLRIIETGDDWSTSNDSSVVCLLESGNITVLFTGDMSEKVEQTCLSLFPTDWDRVDVLKVGHHGSATSTSQAFLDRIDPQYAVISYGVGNTYHHPTAKTLERLLAHGTTVFGTGKSGTIVLTIDTMQYLFNAGIEALTLADAG